MAILYYTKKYYPVVMPQSAKFEQTGTVVAWKIDRDQFNRDALGELSCPHCEEDMYLRAIGKNVVVFEPKYIC